MPAREVSGVAATAGAVSGVEAVLVPDRRRNPRKARPAKPQVARSAIRLFI